NRRRITTTAKKARFSLVMPSMTATMVPFLHVARTSKRRRDSLDTQNHHQNCSKWRRTLSKKLSF
ncbi:hypothetical protein ANCDUO_21553, partial [Ancylostoma duodenale]